MVSLLASANLGLLITSPRRIGGLSIIAHKKRTCGSGIRRKKDWCNLYFLLLFILNFKRIRIKTFHIIQSIIIFVISKHNGWFLGDLTWFCVDLM